MKANKKLDFAKIKFDDNTKQLSSLQFDDIYYSIEDSIAESEYNFIDANNLSEKFSHLFSKQNSYDSSKEFDNYNYCIAETGFGTGLNFLLTASLWKKYKNKKIISNESINDATDNTKKPRLTYIACEKHPINLSDLKKVHASYSRQDFLKITDYLYENYPPNNEGFYLISFPDCDIDLLLLYGDATEQLSELVAEVDTWYLDGFNPAKNKEMWCDNLFAQIKRLSHSDTTISSFSSASNVRKSLENIDAVVTKRKGFGRKREMITASFTSELLNDDILAPLVPAWGYYPKNNDKIRTIAIIGAGIAGSVLAKTLAEQGMHVVLIEKDSVPKGASTVTAASTHLHPSHSSDADNDKRDFDMSAYFYAISQLNTLFPKSSECVENKLWKQTGLVDLDDDIRREKLLQNIKVDDYIMEVSYKGKPAIFYPKSGALHPKEIINELINHEKITQLFDTQITDFQSTNFSCSNWKLTTSNRASQIQLDRYEISHVVLCAGYLTYELYPEIKKISKFMRGQLTQFSSDQTMSDQVICKQNMLIKHSDNLFYAGGTYDLKTLGLQPTEKDDEINYHNLIKADIDFENSVATNEKFVGIRLASNDTLPFVGMTPNYDSFKSTYHYLTKNARKKITQTAKYSPNIYINSALGSKGMIYAFLNAKIISALIFNTPIPVPYKELIAVNPARFIIRKLKRNEDVD